MGNELAAIQAELGAALVKRSPAEGCGHLRDGLARWAALRNEGHFAEENAATRAYFEGLAAQCPAAAS
jgi:hypothetical protein